MPWISTAVSVGGSLLGGALSGGGGRLEAKDAAAAAQRQQENAQRKVESSLNPYLQSGEASNRLLSEYLGTADPAGYAPRPTLQQFEDQLRNEHFQWAGRDYNRNSNIAGQRIEAQMRYDEAMKQWESGKQEYIKNNPGSQGTGSLLKQFTNEDFVKDPGYNFRLAEGEKGVNRAMAARGGYDSGSALKAIAKYNQDFGSNEFNNAYNRDAQDKSRIYNFLSGDKQTGLNAAGTLAGVTQNTANNIGNIGTNATNTVNQLQQNSNTTYANALQGAIGNLIYGANRAKDSAVTGIPTWSTPGINGSASSSKPWYLE